MNFTPLLIVLQLHMVHGFIAYDCNGPKLNITAFNSLSVEPCEPPSEIHTQSIQRIQLLQKTDTYQIPYKTCSIIINYFISRCSILEDAQMVENGFFTEITELGSARCSELHQRLTYHLPNGGIITGLKVNETILSSVTVAGFVDRHGNCKGSTFSSEKGTWQEVIVQANYKITLTEGLAIVNHKQNTLTLPTGSTLKLSDQYGLDIYKGEVVWNANTYDCETHEFIILYDGPASLITSNNYKTSRTYLVESDQIVFALQHIRSTYICNIPAIQTDHSQLTIITDSLFFNYFKNKDIHPQNIDLVAYINTKLVYIDNRFKASITTLYTDLIQKQCELERKVLLHKLSLATYSLSEFAYHMGEGPGYTALKAGEIIYLLKCKPVEVEISSKKNAICYDELPVIYNNKSYFMAPKTRTLQKFGTELDCNHFLPPAFLLDGEWYTTSQNIREIKKPQTLKPSTKWTWTYKSMENLMTAGIYNYDTMKNFQQYLILPQEIEASQKNLARQTMGFTIMDHRINLNTLIDENTISNMVDNKLRKMWGWFTIFGEFISGLLGIFFIWKIILTCINTGLNISLLYQTFGLSIKLVAGVFTSITHFIMHNANQNQQQQQKKQQNQPLLTLNRNPNSRDKVNKSITNSKQKSLYPNIRKLSI